MTASVAAERVGVGRTRVPLRATYFVMLFLLYLPIVLLFMFSFSENTVLIFPLKGFTLDWYREASRPTGRCSSRRGTR